MATDRHLLLRPRRGSIARYRARRALRRRATRAARGDAQAVDDLAEVAARPEHPLAASALDRLAALCGALGVAEQMADTWLIHPVRFGVLADVLSSTGTCPSTDAPRWTPLRLWLGRPPPEPWTAQHADALLAALEDPVPEVRTAAHTELLATDSDVTVQALARRWDAEGSERLDDLVATLGRVPSAPIELRVRVALRLEADDVLTDLPAAAVPVLLDAADDDDRFRSRRARAALRALTDAGAREQLCARALDGDTVAQGAVWAGGFVPAGDADRAATMLVTGQYDRYEDVDVDGRLLAVAYRDADAGRRRVLREAVRSSGRGDVARMLLGSGERVGARALTDAETTHLAQTLIARGRHDRLWRIARDLPLAGMLEAAARLSATRWRPADPSESALLARAADAATDAPAMRQRLPEDLTPARPVAAALPQGRAAIAPGGTHIAVAGGTTLTMWHTVKRAALWSQSVGAEPGALVPFSQRRVVASVQRDSDVDIVLAEPGRTTVLGTVAGQPAVRLWRWGDHSVVGLARRTALVVWALAGGPPHEIALRHDHAVADVDVDADTGRAAVRYRNGEVAVIDLRTGREVASGAVTAPSAGAVGVRFAPGGAELLVDRGPVSVRKIAPAGLDAGRAWDDGAAAEAGRRVVQTLPGRGLVLADDGLHRDHRLRVHAWPAGELLGEVALPRAGHVDAAGMPPSRPDDVLALVRGFDPQGFPRSTVVDLRGACVLALFTRPLAETTPADLALLASVSIPTLSAPSRAAVEVLTAVLRLRFRDAVEITTDDPWEVTPTEGDIDLDDREEP